MNSTKSMGAGHGDGKSTLFPSQRSKQSCFLTKIAKALKKKISFLAVCLSFFFMMRGMQPAENG